MIAPKFFFFFGKLNGHSGVEHTQNICDNPSIKDFWNFIHVFFLFLKRKTDESLASELSDEKYKKSIDAAGIDTNHGPLLLKSEIIIDVISTISKYIFYL